MKSQAGVFPLELAVLEDPPYLALEVGNHRLVVDVEHLAWQDVVPVVHQPLILQVVFAKFDQVIRKRLALGKQLLVGRTA